MLEAVVDLWSEPADARCITTNGFIKKNGALVMGAGVAAQAQKRYSDLPKFWGAQVQKHGNHVWAYSRSNEEFLLSFPVKHNWYEDADLKLIEQSANELMAIVTHVELQKVLLPRPGCGNGRLKWEDVKPVIEPILDDRVVVVIRSPW